MKTINTIDDFFRFIDEGSKLGYKVCLKDTSFQKDWTADHHLKHIEVIRQNCDEAKIELTCESVEIEGHVLEVMVSEKHPSNKGMPAITEWSLWTVRYGK